MRAKTLLKMAENLNAELIRRGDNLLEMWKKEVAENCDRIRENQTLKTERDQLLAKVDQLENDELPRCKDALRRANTIGVEMDEKNQQLQKENDELKKGTQIAAKSFFRMLSLYRIKCRELEIANSEKKTQRGAWIQDVRDIQKDMITCSCCHQKWNIYDNDTQTFLYCPNCGAKMEGGSDGQAT